MPTTATKAAVVITAAADRRSHSGHCGTRRSTQREKASISSSRNTATTRGVMISCRYLITTPATTTAMKTIALRTTPDRQTAVGPPSFERDAPSVLIRLPPPSAPGLSRGERLGQERVHAAERALEATS